MAAFGGYTLARRALRPIDHRGGTYETVRRISAVLFVGLTSVAGAQDVPAEYQQVLTTLGKQGDYKANVLKVNIPRNDINVTVANVKTPTPFAADDLFPPLLGHRVCREARDRLQSRRERVGEGDVFAIEDAVLPFRDQLEEFKTSRGTVQFPIDKPLPIRLIKKIVKARIDEVDPKRSRDERQDGWCL